MKPVTVPIFFATDSRYAPYLSVALCSLIDNSSKRNNYDIHILTDSLESGICEKLLSMQTENIKIDIVSVASRLDEIGMLLHLRDYYSKATYYRFFIPALFPQYQKGIYLDCDIILTEDIAKLYSTDLADNLIGAVQEDIMSRFRVFGRYVETVLDMPCGEYFNAGVLLMNLEEMRRVNIESRFVELLKRRAFRLTQDQDYLNVLCRERRLILGYEWNKTAFPGMLFEENANIVHFKLHFKPWHYDSVPYENQFWYYAGMTPFYDGILSEFARYSPEQKARDAQNFLRLKQLALNEILKNTKTYDNFCFPEQITRIGV